MNIEAYFKAFSGNAPRATEAQTSRRFGSSPLSTRALRRSPGGPGILRPSAPRWTPGRETRPKSSRGTFDGRAGAREDMSDYINRLLQSKPNPYMTAYAFYYRVAAQFAVYNNAFILPVFDGGKLTALYPINASRVDLVEYMGQMYARLTFATARSIPSPTSRLSTSAVTISITIFSATTTRR